MAVKYNEEFKKQVVQAYLEGTKSTVQIAEDFNVSKTSVLSWANQYSEECQYNKSTISQEDKISSAKEIRRLNKVILEQQKEIEFLKKAAAFFAKEID